MQKRSIPPTPTTTPTAGAPTTAAQRISDAPAAADSEMLEAAATLQLFSARAAADASAAKEQQAHEKRIRARDEVFRTLPYLFRVVREFPGTALAAKAMADVAELRDRALRYCLERLGEMANKPFTPETFERLWMRIANGINPAKPRMVSVNTTGLEPGEARTLVHALSYFPGIEYVHVWGTGPLLHIAPTSLSIVQTLAHVILQGPSACMSAIGAAALAISRSEHRTGNTLPALLRSLTLADFATDDAAVRVVQDAIDFLAANIGTADSALKLLKIVHTRSESQAPAKPMDVRKLIDAALKLADEGRPQFTALNFVGIEFCFPDETAAGLARLYAHRHCRFEYAAVSTGLSVAPLMDAIKRSQTIDKLVWATPDLSALSEFFKDSPKINTVSVQIPEGIVESEDVSFIAKNENLRTLVISDNIADVHVERIFRAMATCHFVTTLNILRMHEKRNRFSLSVMGALICLLRDSPAIRLLTVPLRCFYGTTFATFKRHKALTERFDVSEDNGTAVFARKASPERPNTTDQASVRKRKAQGGEEEEPTGSASSQPESKKQRTDDQKGN